MLFIYGLLKKQFVILTGFQRDFNVQEDDTNETKKLYVYPITVEDMASILKQLCSLYLLEQLNIIQFESEILDLKNKFNALLLSALNVRWIGKNVFV